MTLSGTTIRIASDTAGGADARCGVCSRDRQAALCRQLPEPVSGPPLLVGPPALTSQLLQALGAALAEPVTGPGNRLVRKLDCRDGEATLQLSLPPQCRGGADMVQTAFETLRRLLPDTDIYITHPD